MSVVVGVTRTCQKDGFKVSMIKKVFLYCLNLLMMTLLTTSICASGEYVLDASPKSGYQIGLHRPTNADICAEYKKAVIDFQKAKAPLICDRPIDPQNQLFGKPVWRSLKTTNALKMGEAVVRFSLRSRLAKETDPKKREGIVNWKMELIKKGIREGYLHYAVAKLDIDNNDGSERIVRVKNTSWDCSGSNLRAKTYRDNVRLYVFKITGNTYEIVETVNSRNPGQVFFFRGRTYLDRWFESTGEYWAVFVQEPKRLSTGNIYAATVCRFQYVD